MKPHNCIYCGDKCRPCWLYVVADRDGGGPVKVGISFHPTRRLAQHRKKTGRDLAVHYKREFPCEFAASDAEDVATEALADARVRGDWFSVSVAHAIKIASGAKRGGRKS